MRRSVCIGVRRHAFESRLSGNAVHLTPYLSTSQEFNYNRPCLLGAPALDDTGEHDLLGVIGDEGYKIVNDAMEVAIRTPADNRGRHPGKEWA
jgi:hypothetical protein